MDAVNSFVVSFYRWSLTDAIREVRQDFPLLRGVKQALAQRFIKMMVQLSPEEQVQLAIALVKRDADAVSRAAETVSPQEIRLQQLYANDAPLFAFDPERPAEVTKPIRRKVLKSLVIPEAKAVLGDDLENLGDGSFRFTTQCGRFVVRTFIDLGGRFHQLSYDHEVFSKRGESLKRFISVCSWCGLGGQTLWQGVSDAEGPMTARALSRCLSHFLSGLEDVALEEGNATGPINDSSSS